MMNGEQTINMATARAAILPNMPTSLMTGRCVHRALARFFHFRRRDSSAAAAAALRRARGRGNIRKQRGGILMRSRTILVSTQWGGRLLYRPPLLRLD